MSRSKAGRRSNEETRSKHLSAEGSKKACETATLMERKGLTRLATSQHSIIPNSNFREWGILATTKTSVPFPNTTHLISPLAILTALHHHSASFSSSSHPTSKPSPTPSPQILQPNQSPIAHTILIHPLRRNSDIPQRKDVNHKLIHGINIRLPPRTSPAAAVLRSKSFWGAIH